MAKMRNHRDYIREQSPEMARENDWPAMDCCGVECVSSPGPTRVHKSGSTAPTRSTT